MRSHTRTHARPDEKMGRLEIPSSWFAARASSAMRRVLKRSAAKKRRQRDRLP